MAELKETDWTYIHGEKTGTFYSGETKWINKIHKWKEQYPDEVDIKVINEDGSMVVHLPYKWAKFSPNKKRIMTEEQRQAASERMKKMSENRKNNL